jgi:cytidylate kinase
MPKATTSTVTRGRPVVVAIDGPSGSGKSSTARGVARRLGLAFLDTGAMYRAATWLALKRGVDLADVDAVAELVRGAEMEMVLEPDAFSIAIDGHDVTKAIRAPRVSAVVSAVATNLAVRVDLLDRQRDLIAGSCKGIVAEGRDITTVVAPDADVRVLLVADPQARIARRHAELADHADADVDAIIDQVIRRDRDDSTVAQFTLAAPGVHVIDSTELTLSQVVAAICDLVPAASPGTP